MLRLHNNNERENYHEPLSFFIIPTFDVFTKAQDKSVQNKSSSYSQAIYRGKPSARKT
jgi:hypothetical protein